MDFFCHELHEFPQIFILLPISILNKARGFNHGKRYRLDVIIYCVPVVETTRLCFEHFAENLQSKICGNSCNSWQITFVSLYLCPFEPLNTLQNWKTNNFLFKNKQFVTICYFSTNNLQIVKSVITLPKMI